MNFAEWEALKGIGATLTEILEWERGNDTFPVWFKAKVLAWFELHEQVGLHKQDAATPKK